MENERLRDLLLRSGYHIREREDGWSECLITGHGECWHGRGLGADEAFERALAGLFPSRVALDLLRSALEAPVAPGEEPTEAPRQGTPPPPHAAAEAAMSAREVEAAEPAMSAREVEVAEPAISAREVEVAEEDRPAAAPTGARSVAEGLPEVGPSTHPAPEAGAPSRAEASASEADRAAARAKEEEAEALAELACLEARIETALPELAEAAPHRQRLVLLGWVAQARHHQDLLPSSAPVYARVSRIVRALRCKSDGWWPGMIAAFQRRAHPAVAARDLKELSPSSLLSWERVAEAAQQALSQAEKEDEALGRDELGWADEEALSPPPREPSALFDALRAALEGCGGDLFGWQPKELAPPPEAELLRWARLLRWLRNRVDAAAWGAAMGRLRFWAGAIASDRLRALLDAGHRPASSWASLVMADGERLQLLEVERILAAAPAPRAGEQQIVSWLERVLPHTSKYKRAVEDAARPLAEQIFLIDERQLPEADRRIRRRLQKLKEALAAGEEARGAARDEAAEPPRAEAAPEEVPEILRRETEGLRVLYVSNRSEERLREKLQARFGFRALAWEEAAPRRVAAAAASIATGSHDLVLGATGFLGHSCDVRLRKACKAVGVPYVRVMKGKSGEVQFSLERDLLGIPGRERARVTA